MSSIVGASLFCLYQEVTRLVLFCLLVSRDLYSSAVWSILVLFPCITNCTLLLCGASLFCFLVSHIIIIKLVSRDLFHYLSSFSLSLSKLFSLLKLQVSLFLCHQTKVEIVIACITFIKVIISCQGSSFSLAFIKILSLVWLCRESRDLYVCVESHETCMFISFKSTRITLP